MRAFLIPFQVSGASFAAWILALLLSASSAHGDDSFFETRIRPVLIASCFKCHGGEKESGKLRVDSREALIRGGESGAAITPGDPAKSLLLNAIRRTSEDLVMPPGKDNALPAAVVADFEKWIKGGAVWPAKATPFQGGRHWAFEPVKAPQPPADAVVHPVDHFIHAKLAASSVKPLGKADKRTLIRRATFDLTGLPPTPADVDAFLADDSSDAFAKVIERLLASPHYGERWGRHWLDVVRYADTAGETADFPAPHAWRYRNYVIAAFNSDKPYDQFIREQIAGDILAKQDPGIAADRYAELITATGYIAIARRFGFDLDKDHFLTIDDTIDTLGKSVLALTVGCARCHDHKYDPISTQDYYALYGIFDSTRYPFPGCEKTPRMRDMMVLASPAEIERTMKPHREQVAAADEAIRKLEAATQAVASQLKADLAAATKVIAKEKIDEGGSQAFTVEGNGLDRVTVRTGQAIQLVISPRTNHGGDSTSVDLQIVELGGKGRTWDAKSDLVDSLPAGNPHADRHGHVGVWCFFDLHQGVTLLPESLPDIFGNKGLHVWRRGDTPSVFVNSTDNPIKVWTSLPAKTFFAHPGPSGPVGVTWVSPIDGEVAIKGSVADAHPANGDGIEWSIEHIAADLASALQKLPEHAKALADAKKHRAELAAREPKLQVAYGVTEGSPHHVPVFLRGDPETRGEIVPRRMLSLLGGQAVPEGAGSGRLQLAQWLTDPANPLTARVMVNRIWQHHFGAGLVRTANDFGLRGTPPMHPQLLDYLAHRFVKEKWSIKAMHRLIMLSDAYQRSDRPSGGDASRPDSAAASDVTRGESVDPGNTLLWRFDRRRLSAEEIRDAILFVSDDLDATPGEAHAFPDEKTWGFTQHNPFAAVYDHNRRSIYLMTQRIKRHPFLTLFDGADASASTAERHTSTMPTQALFFLNDPFVHARAKSLSERLLKLATDEARIDHLFRTMYGRAARPGEAANALRFVSEYTGELNDVPAGDRVRTAWAAWVRVMFGSNEFLYVD